MEEQILEETSSQQNTLTECINSNWCGWIYKKLLENEGLLKVSLPVRLAEFNGLYYPFGNGHHRICISKRLNLYIWADVSRCILLNI